MENALLIGLSRQTTLERQLTVIANNVANVNTSGFKSDQSLFEEYLSSGAHEDNFVGRDRRVSYVKDGGTYRDFSQGALQQTGNPLDVAIQGDGLFVVQTPNGERYTRDGNFQLNAQGQMVTSNGYPVLGNNGPVTFQSTEHDINISPDGTVTSVDGNAPNDAIRSKLRIVSFANQQQSLTKEGDNLYSAANPADAQPDQTSILRQGYVEKSNVNAVGEMTRLIDVSRTYAQVANMLQQQGDLHKNAINQLADVPT